ncbi:AAA family ATPase [Spirillospora sp. NPDC048819]|uniref:AAA family ATPase n=1 Tax=Spirillospora sp. NPDC048819 TaxID=3155268 RepID=UPI0033D82C45
MSGTPPFPGTAELTSSAIVGRESELDLLARAVRAAADGRGGMLALAGEAGIGKSRLRAAAEADARRRGLPVLAGRAADTAVAEPFRPLSEALARHWRDGGPPGDPRLRPLLPTLGQLVPGWRTGDRDPVSLAAVCEAVLRLLAVVGDRSGALLVIEDAHWCDAETLAVLEYLADNADAHRTLCLVTLRTDPPGPAGDTIRRLADRRAAAVVPLERMDGAAIDTLVLSCLREQAVPEPLLDHVRQRADGVPFYVEELLAGLVRSGALVRDDDGWRLRGTLNAQVPGTMGESVRRGLESLTPAAQRTLLAAALLGRRFDWRLLPEVTGLGRDEVAAALREAANARLLTVEAGALVFRHALVRERIRALLLPSDHAILGARALAAIERAHPGLPGSRCELAAELAEATGDRERAVTHLTEAARRARDRGALASAEPLLRRAVDLSPPARGPVGALAEVLALAGEVDEALKLAAVALENTPGPDGAQTDLELALARAMLAAGRHDEASAHADRAGVRAAGPHHHDRQARATALQALIAVDAGRLDAAVRLAEEVLGSFPGPAEAHCQALEATGRATRVHDLARAESAFESALALADRHGLSLWRARALQELGTIDLFDRLRADRLQQARGAAIEAGSPAIAAVADMHLALVWVCRGHPVTARRPAERAVAVSRRLGLSLLPYALVTLARTYAHERDHVAVDRVTAEIESLAPGDPAVEAAVDGNVHVMLALHEADRQGALAALDRATGLLDTLPGEHFPHWGLWALLRVLDDDATATGADVLRRARRGAGSDTRFNVALLRAADAVLAGRRGDHDRASRDFDGALALIGHYQEPEFLHHLTCWTVAPAALADGWGEPVTWLSAAVRWFAAGRYEPLATSCRVLLRQAGAPVPRAGRGAAAVPDDLREMGVTSREMDVLVLLAERLSNKEIADRLVLSPRTVEKHVTSLLLKTGSADRAALARLSRVHPDR